MNCSIHSLDIALTGGREKRKKKTPFPVSPFSPRADARAEQANESAARSLAAAVNAAVSKRAASPPSPADRQAL